MGQLLKQLEVITVKQETAHEAMKIGRVIGGYYELSEEGKRIVEEAILAAVQARMAAREPVVEHELEDPEDIAENSNKPYKDSQVAEMTQMFAEDLKILGFVQPATIQYLSKQLGRSYKAISRQGYDFKNKRGIWAK